MRQIEQWPHKWFGVWREYGPAFQKCPSVYDFVFPEIVANYDKDHLCHYLDNGHAIAATSRASFPCPFTGTRYSGSISYRTDGKWLWLDDLPHYIDQFNVAIPSQWMSDIQEQDFKLAPVSEQLILSLDWPPVTV